METQVGGSFEGQERTPVGLIAGLMGSKGSRSGCSDYCQLVINLDFLFCGFLFLKIHH